MRINIRFNLSKNNKMELLCDPMKAETTNGLIYIQITFKIFELRKLNNNLYLLIPGKIKYIFKNYK